MIRHYNVSDWLDVPVTTTDAESDEEIELAADD
jgi:hypothetical protein